MGISESQAEKQEYVVYEDWVERGRFSRPDAALFFQQFRKYLHPKSKVQAFCKQGNTITLIEGDWRTYSALGIQDHRMLNRMKGGEKRMVNGKENKPVKKFQSGAVSAALWTNTTTLKDGRSIETLSVTLDRRYKDSDGEWKSSSSFKENDIPKAMLVLGKAFEFMTSSEANAAEGTAD
jgi:hypothetical protein